MKAEYDFYLGSPSLIIMGCDFIEAINNEKKRDILKSIVFGFSNYYEVESHFNDEAINEIIDSISDEDEVIYLINSRYAGRVFIENWSEVIINKKGNRPFKLITSYDEGRTYFIKNNMRDEE